MEHGHATARAHPVNALFQAGRLADLSDAELLERSLRAEPEPDIAEMAFAVLIRRHGPMVQRVCRATLGDWHEAEDAFQATFLILVREARRLKVRDTLGPWLYQVALRVSLFARNARLRRDRHEQEAARRTAAGGGGQDVLVQDEDSRTIHAEISRLPARFRTCLILCDLEGLTYAEAARQLHLPLGTVQSRLARARKRLRQSLIRRGLGPDQDKAVALTAFLPGLGSGLTPHLIERTSRLCVQLVAHGSTGAGRISSSIAALASGGRKMILISRLSRIGMPVAVFILAGGLAVYSQTGRHGRPPSPPREPVRPSAQLYQSTAPEQIAAPREIQATGGLGKLLVYELDKGGKRITIPGEMKANKWGNSFPHHKEVERAYHWAVVTGVVDHRAIQENARQAGFDNLDPQHFYRRVELQRQTRDVSGNWSNWSMVNPEPTYLVLDNIPEETEELVQPIVQPLVDPLPLQRHGKWRGVNIERLIPKQATESPAEPVSATLGMIRGRPEEASSQLASAIQKSVRGQPATSQQFPPDLMLRSLDFSVTPDQTYRYRARVVVLNLRHVPGRGGWPTLLFGDWSKPTNAVTVP